MIYSLLAVAGVGWLVYLYKRWRKKPEPERIAFAKQSLLWICIAALLVLVVAGRAHWIMAVLAAVLAILGRLVQIAQYIPLFKEMFGEKKSTSAPPATKQSQMTRAEAADILGIDVNATEDDIRLAHKKLMQKLHPDRGGSDALAKQINQAKDVLSK